MAIYHLSATPVQRSKGHSAVAGAAYRSGEEIRDRSTGITHDYSRKRGIVQSEILTPADAPSWTRDRTELWNRAEEAEKRKDGQPAREIRLALPAELTDEQRAALVFDYAKAAFVDSGMIADISIHRPDRHGDERNHHAHIYVTMRELDGDQFSAKKNREWNQTETLEAWRAMWQEYANAALEDAGSDARIDHRSLEAQGIDREATHHLGKDANAIEREGKHSRIGDENRAVERRNQELDRLFETYAALETEIAQELQREFLPNEQEGQEPDEASAAWAVKIDERGRQQWTYGNDEQSIIMKWQAEPELTPFNSDITRAYLAEPAPSMEAEEEEQNLARWYNVFYTRAVETVQSYWSKFVDRLTISRDDPGRGEPEPER